MSVELPGRMPDRKFRPLFHSLPLYRELPKLTQHANNDVNRGKVNSLGAVELRYNQRCRLVAKEPTVSSTFNRLVLPGLRYACLS